VARPAAAVVLISLQILGHPLSPGFPGIARPWSVLVAVCLVRGVNRLAAGRLLAGRVRAVRLDASVSQEFARTKDHHPSTTVTIQLLALLVDASGLVGSGGRE